MVTPVWIRLFPIKTNVVRHEKIYLGEYVVTTNLTSTWGWLGEAKVSCILRHRASNWYWLTVGQRPATLAADGGIEGEVGRGGGGGEEE